MAASAMQNIVYFYFKKFVRIQNQSVEDSNSLRNCLPPISLHFGGRLKAKTSEPVV